MRLVPNLLLLVLDDHGWADVGANDPTTTETPQLDKLISRGVRFTDFHVGASVCTPSRAALLTGRLCPRTGVCRNFSPLSRYGMATTERTIADVLSATHESRASARLEPSTSGSPPPCLACPSPLC